MANREIPALGAGVNRGIPEMPLYLHLRSELELLFGGISEMENLNEAIERAVNIMRIKEAEWYEDLLSTLLDAMLSGNRDLDAERALADLGPPDDPLVKELYTVLLGGSKRTN